MRGRREFTLVMRRGAPAATDALTIFALAARGIDARTKVGVIIPKTVGKAVVRNRLRRRCKAILDRACGSAPHRWYVVQFRRGAAGLAFEDLQKHLTSALARARGPRRSERSRR